MIGRLRLVGVGEKMTRRLAAGVLAGQAVALFFGALSAWGVSRTQEGEPATAYLLVGLGLAMLCVAVAGMQRRPYGVTLGWLLQAATLASSFVVPAMLFVALIFLALWVTALFQGHKMDELTRRHTPSDRSTA